MSRATWVSPGRWLVAAALLVLAFAIAHMLGLREHMSELSAATPSTGASAGLALLYAISYFGAVLVAPVLVIGSGLLWGMLALERRATREQST